MFRAEMHASAVQGSNYSVFRFKASEASARTWELEQFLASSGLALERAPISGLECTVVRFERYFVARVRAYGATLTWTRERSSAQKRAAFLIASNGNLIVETSAPHATNQHAGVVVLPPSDRSVTLDTQLHAEFMVYSFDASSFPPFEIDEHAVAELAPTTPALRSAYAFLATLVESCATSDDDETPSLGPMLRSVAMTLVGSCAARDAKPVSLQDQARGLIAEESIDPRFDVTALATRMGVSRRTLFRTFAQVDSSVNSEIQLDRTRRAIALLQTSPTMPVSLLVKRSGFSTSSTLSRAIRAYCGCSLRELRVQLMRPGADIDRLYGLVVPGGESSAAG